MDKRIYIIAALAVLAVILTIVREWESGESEPMSLPFSSKQNVSGDRVYAMADTTLRSLGIEKKNIRPVKNRNDVRVLYPAKFDVLNFISAMKDSLDDYNAEVFSVDNAREKTSIVQIKNGDVVLRSFIFSKEPVQAIKKGATPSVKK
ncbi:MAG: hypothetical protein AB1728_06460 [Bacteroidota bacterium]